MSDQGGVVTQTTALLHRDEKTLAAKPGLGMLLMTATSKSLGPLKLAISYETDEESDVAYVETLQGEACVVPDSGDWKTVHAILNAEEKGRPLLECEEAVVLKTERFTNAKTEPHFTKEDDNDFISSKSVSTDPKNKISTISLHMDRHLGVFITQDPVYQTRSKIAIKHRNFKGDFTTRVVYANKNPIKLPPGDLNAAVYNTGFCVVSGFETWFDIESVDFVVAA